MRTGRRTKEDLLFSRASFVDLEAAGRKTKEQAGRLFLPALTSCTAYSGLLNHRGFPESQSLMSVWLRQKASHEITKNTKKSHNTDVTERTEPRSLRRRRFAARSRRMRHSNVKLRDQHALRLSVARRLRPACVGIPCRSATKRPGVHGSSGSGFCGCANPCLPCRFLRVIRGSAFSGRFAPDRGASRGRA